MCNGEARVEVIEKEQRAKVGSLWSGGPRGNGTGERCQVILQGDGNDEVTCCYKRTREL